MLRLFLGLGWRAGRRKGKGKGKGRRKGNGRRKRRQGVEGVGGVDAVLASDDEDGVLHLGVLLHLVNFLETKVAIVLLGMRADLSGRAGADMSTH